MCFRMLVRHSREIGIWGIRWQRCGLRLRMIWIRMLWLEVSFLWSGIICVRSLIRGVDLGMPEWLQYGEDRNSMVFNGYGSWIEKDTYREEAIRYIIDNVLQDGAL